MKPRLIFFGGGGLFALLLFVIGLINIIASEPTPGQPSPPGFIIGSVLAMMASLTVLVLGFIRTVLAGKEPAKERAVTGQH